MAEQVNSIVKNLLDHLRFEGRWIVFLVFVGIASFFWILRVMEKTYSTEINQALEFTDIPDDRTIVSDLPDKLTLQIEGPGASILRNNWNPRKNTIRINFRQVFRTQLNQTNLDEWSISSNQLKSRINSQLTNLVVTGIQPDSLSFKLSSAASRRVPVMPNIVFELEKQFMIRDKIQVEPDTIELSGPAAILDTLQGIYTTSLRFRKLDHTVRRNLALDIPDQLSSPVKRVSIEIPIEQFTEKIIEIPITAIHVPDSLQLKTFPASVETRFRVVISAFDQIDHTDFRIVVDYNDIETSISQKLKPKIELAPSLIDNPKIQPELVDYLLEHK